MPRFPVFEDNPDTPTRTQSEQRDPSPSSTHLMEHPTNTNRLARGRRESRKIILDSDPEDDVKTEPDAYSLDRTIEEARAHYGDKPPPFCVKTREDTNRYVRLSGTTRRVPITFHTWNHVFGYWILADQAGDEYIVKCFSNRYCTWEGVSNGFSEEPVAYVLTASDKGLSRSRSESSQPGDDPVPVVTRSLRPRRTIQNKPYTMYNTQKKYDKKGVRLSSAQLEEAVEEQAATPKCKATTTRKKQRVSSNVGSDPGVQDRSLSVLSGIESSSTTLNTFDTMQHGNVGLETILRTRLDGFELASIPLKAYDFDSNISLFAEIEKKWSRQLGSRQISYCIVKFPWVGEDKNILLQSNENDSFNFMIEELSNAPMLKGEHRVEVVIEIHTE